MNTSISEWSWVLWRKQQNSNGHFKDAASPGFALFLSGKKIVIPWIDRGGASLGFSHDPVSRNDDLHNKADQSQPHGEYSIDRHLNFNHRLRLDP